MTVRHEFEDEYGNETELTEITYEVIKTYVQPDPVEEGVIVFTHIIRIRPEALDMEMMFLPDDEGGD